MTYNLTDFSLDALYSLRDQMAEVASDLSASLQTMPELDDLDETEDLRHANMQFAYGLMDACIAEILRRT